MLCLTLRNWCDSTQKKGTKKRANPEGLARLVYFGSFGSVSLTLSRSAADAMKPSKVA